MELISPRLDLLVSRIAASRVAVSARSSAGISLCASASAMITEFRTRPRIASALATSSLRAALLSVGASTVGVVEVGVVSVEVERRAYSGIGSTTYPNQAPYSA